MCIQDNLRNVIFGGEVGKIASILNIGDVANSNISMRARECPDLKISPLIYVLGLAALEVGRYKGCYSTSRSTLVNAKKIIEILQEKGAPKELSEEHFKEAMNFMEEINYMKPNTVPMHNHQAIKNRMRFLLDDVNRVRDSSLMIMGHKDKETAHFILPNEIVKKIVGNLHELHMLDPFCRFFVNNL